MAANYDLKIDQGADYSILLTWKDSNGDPIPNTGFHAKLQVKERYDSDADTALVTISDTTSGITLGGNDGTFLIEMTGTQTANLPSGECVYDMRITDTMDKLKRLIQGKVIVNPQVTK